MDTRRIWLGDEGDPEDVLILVGDDDKLPVAFLGGEAVIPGDDPDLSANGARGTGFDARLMPAPNECPRISGCGRKFASCLLVSECVEGGLEWCLSGV
jgi:hypothetical protein